MEMKFFGKEKSWWALLPSVMLYERHVDVVLVTNEDDPQRFKVHKLILSLSSRYFDTLFTTSNEPEYVMMNIKPRCLHEIINYLYTGVIEIGDVDCASDLLEAAQSIQVNEVVDHCVEFLVSQVDAQNCLYFWKMTAGIENKEKTRKIMELAVKQFDYFREKAEFRALKEDQMLDYLMEVVKYGGKTKGEIEVAWLAWMKYDPDNRSLSFVQLQQNLEAVEYEECVTVAEVPKAISEKKNAVTANNDIYNTENYTKNLKCKTVLFTNPSNLRMSYLKHFDFVQKQWSEPVAFPLESDEQVLGEFEGKVFTWYLSLAKSPLCWTILKRDYVLNSKAIIAQFESRGDGHFVVHVKLGHYLYIILVHSVYQLDLVDEITRPIDRAPVYKYNCAATTFEEKIYVVFHHDFVEYFMDIFDPKTDIWETFRSNMVLEPNGVLRPYEGHLYYVANLIKRFDLNTKMWTKEDNDDIRRIVGKVPFQKYTPPLKSNSELAELFPVEPNRARRHKLCLIS